MSILRPRSVESINWTLAPEDAFDLVDEPPLLAGSVSDDIEELRASLTFPAEEHVVWHELDHAAHVLRFLTYCLLRSP